MKVKMFFLSLAAMLCMSAADAKTGPPGKYSMQNTVLMASWEVISFEDEHDFLDTYSQILFQWGNEFGEIRNGDYVLEYYYDENGDMHWRWVYRPLVRM